MTGSRLQEKRKVRDKRRIVIGFIVAGFNTIFLNLCELGSKSK